MGIRRKAREVSLQLLYEIDLCHKSWDEVFEEFRDKFITSLIGEEEVSDSGKEIREFTKQIVEGTFQNVREIDQLIEQHSTHWKISRMSLVDRNILRMAVFELLYCTDIPASVTINEAIEIAKRYGTDESGAFINGVLDHIAKDLKKD